MTHPLTDNRLHILRERLMTKKRQLEQHVQENGHYGLSSDFRNATGDLSSNDNHPADAGTEMFERSKDFALMERESLELDRIEAALARMESGEYGRCVTCGSFIPAARLKALPTAIYCTAHEPMQAESERRPIEEAFLTPPFGRTSLDERDDQNGFDGEDAWQIVEAWGSSNTPAMAEGNQLDDYAAIYIEADENDGFVEPIESFLATDITGHEATIIRNRAYYQYLANREGDNGLEPDEWAEDPAYD